MKKLILTILLGIWLIPTQAFHIVGGEIEFIFLADGLYRINLIQYFDEAQDQNPGPEGSILVHIYRKSDDALISSQILGLNSQELVNYTNIECTIDELATSRVVWSNDVNLDPNAYNDSEGYYIVWERCCRNSNIVNIVNPSGTGMKYVLEIPPLMKNGQIFRNSSPVLFKPLSDYACINQLYYIEFTGEDPDGDSLVYSLTTPFNSSAAVALPTPTPEPHFNVAFRDGFSETNMIPGSRPLGISNKGLLTVTPSTTGLYVFSVLVQEYRDGERIGQTRRDFQMLVIDGCEPPDPPVVDVDIPGNPGFNPQLDTLKYTVAAEKCFEFLVANVTPGETITLRAEGVNFDESLNEIFTFNQIPVETTDDELRIEVCIPSCPPIFGEPFILDLIAGDDACPLPQLDTLRMMFLVEPPSNDLPFYNTPTTNIVQPEDNDPIYGQLISGSDADGDSMVMSMFVEGLADPATFGFNLEVTNSTKGSIDGRISWDTDCELFDFGVDQDFKIGIIIEDLDSCSVPNDTLFINSSVILPLNTDPIVSTSAIIPNEINLGSSIDLNVSVTDQDGDDVTLRFIGANFNPTQYGIEFEESTGSGSSTSSFVWDLACNSSIYTDGQEFELLFIGDDADKCKVKNFDTLRTVVKVNYPPNNKPDFEEIARNQVIRVNERTRIEIEAFDLDGGDEITLSLAEGIRQPASASLLFEPVTGTGRVTSILEWQPECSLLRFGETSTFQDIVFQVVDNACPNTELDTLKLTIEIIDDSERQKEFLPPNMFTPNGDGVNDVFTLSSNPEQSQNLPADNCDNGFEYFVINNRAGNTVFRTENRDFVWTGGQFPEGVYYYLAKYTNTEFKGYIHLMR